MPVVANKLEAGPVIEVEVESAANKERQELRARTVTDKSSVGAVGISDISPDSRCVSITNAGGALESLGGWRLQRDVENGRLTFDWSFPSDIVLNAGQVIKIWAKNFRPTEAAMSDLEIDRPSWGLGRETLTTLYDSSGAQQAIFSTNTVFEREE